MDALRARTPVKRPEGRPPDNSGRSGTVPWIGSAPSADINIPTKGRKCELLGAFDYGAPMLALPATRSIRQTPSPRCEASKS